MSSKSKCFNDLVELMILYCLSKKTCYCYEIFKAINNDFDKEKISNNTIYTILYRLKNKKLISEQKVTVNKKRERVYYNILPEGKKYFEECLDEYNAYTCVIEKVLENSKNLIK